MVTKELFNYFEQESYRNGKSSAGFLNQKMSGIYITFPFSPFDPFFEEFDRKLQRLVENGIFGVLAYKYKRNRLYNEDVPPLVLTMDDLSIGFLVCSIPMALSVAVFLLEAMTSKFTFFAEQIRDMLVAVYLVFVAVKILC